MQTATRLADQPDPNKVYTLHINQIEGLEGLWQDILSLSKEPPGFDTALYQQHINQTYLKRICATLEKPPTDEMWRCERDLNYMHSMERNYPRSNSNLYKPESAVVKMPDNKTEAEQAAFAAPLKKLLGQEVLVRGNFFYPPGGFKEWHTNMHHEPGWAMYIVHVEEDHQSWFRYIDPLTKEMVTLWDFNGAVNFFKIDSHRPFWHCIKSENTRRWSRGFMLPDDWNLHLYQKQSK